MGGAADVLESLRIRNLGVIVEATIEMGPGLTVLTGETGAGKTMVLTAINVMLGNKADNGVIREGADRADIEATWCLSPASFGSIAERLADLDAQVEESAHGVVLLASRSLARESRGRTTIGARSVPTSALKDVVEPMVAVHGQADQWRLKRPDEQRAILDHFGGIDLGPYRDAYRAWREAHDALAEFDSDLSQRDAKREQWVVGLAAIDAVQPKVDEDTHLDRLAHVLGHSVGMAQEAGEVRDALDGDGDSSAAAALIKAIRAVERMAAIDPAVQPIRDQLDLAQVHVQEAWAALSGYMSDIEVDPGRLHEVEERRAAIRNLKRLYGPTLDDVVQWRERAERELAQLVDPQAYRDQLSAALEATWAQLVASAHILTKARKAAAKGFAQAVSAELPSLSMPGSSVEVELTPYPDGYRETGAEAIAILLRTHSGGEPRPLSKGASGGELARVMLAIEVVLAGTSAVPTFIFDEVDAGVGGKAAIEVARRLAALGRQAQVLVVSHLPQVAAFADTHIVVHKDSQGSVGTSDVRQVTGQDRIIELARMLSGLDESDSGAEHAKELLELAAAERVAFESNQER
jgi:DNA repair protein RecN (Recombination protein N)